LANIFFSHDLGKLIISLTSELPGELTSARFLSIQDGKRGFDLPFRIVEDRLLSVEIQAAFVVLNIAQFELPMWLASSINHPTGWRERLNLDPSILKRFVDAIQGGQWLRYQKPERLAIFTHVFNEGAMLKLWERHYSQMIHPNCLYVIDDGSTDGSLDQLSAEINRVKLPRGQLDHWNMASWSGYFQRFLLQRYEWVISTDCDELLLFKGGDPIPVLDKYGAKPAIVKPGMVVAPVHRPKDEPAFDFYSDRIFQNRNEIRVEDDMFLKPLIANTQVSWEPGFHLCYEKSQSDEDVVLMHAKYIDAGRLEDSSLNWKLQHQTANDQEVFRRLAEINATTLNEYTKAEMDKAMRREPASLPEWALRF